MSFRTALSGLGAATTSLGVISDNIANNATTGFKASRSEFGDIVANTSAFLAKDQVGIGVAVSSVSQLFGQGNLGFTGNPLDLAVSGSGFFRVSDNGTTLYTRNGAFGVDNSGFMVNDGGQRLQAYQADAAGNITGALGDLRIAQTTSPPVVTTSVSVDANLDATSVPPVAAFSISDPSSFNSSTSLNIFDSQGSPHTASLYFRNTAPNVWESYVAVDGAQVGGVEPMVFDTSGVLTTPAGGTFTTASFTPPGTAAMTVDFDVLAVTQFGTGYSVNFLQQDGASPGELTSVEVDDSGTVLAHYSNNQTTALGQIALANFTNTQGLIRVGDNNWAESFDSGPDLVGEPGSSGFGLIQSGALEGSNVDLTEELVNLIEAQRSYQANAQVISANDTLTQTILNL